MTREPEPYYFLAPGAARFLARFLGADPDTFGGRIDNTPENRNALARALDKARHRGVRSSLRAALRRFDPEAVPNPRKRPSRVFVLFCRPRCRTFKVRTTATAADSACTIRTFLRACERDGARLAIVEAATADDARARLARFHADPENIGTMLASAAEGRAIGLGPKGATALWSVIRAPDGAIRDPLTGGPSWSALPPDVDRLLSPET